MSTSEWRRRALLAEAARDRFRAALDARNGVERIGLNEDGTLDEIVAHGLGHVEQLDTGCWFVEIGGLAFTFYSTRAIKAQPRDFNSWTAAAAPPAARGDE